jgi:hypothetical protein
MGNQRPDTDDRMVDVLGELIAQFGSNLVITLACMAVRISEAPQVRNGLNIPNDNPVHDTALKADDCAKLGLRGRNGSGIIQPRASIAWPWRCEQISGLFLRP